MARFFTETGHIIAMKKIYTTYYLPQCNGNFERFNGKIITALRDYLNYHPLQLDQFSSTLNYAYKTKDQRTTNTESFYLVLSRTPLQLELYYEPKLDPK